MGQLFSSGDQEEQIDTLTGLPQQCSQFSNDEIAYRSKQLWTILRVMGILSDIEEQKIIDIQNPAEYLVDIEGVVYDLFLETPSPITLNIFKPGRKIHAVRGKVVQTETYTPLHMYNDFILIEFPVLQSSDKILRAKIIREQLFPIQQEIFALVSSYCVDIGKITGIDID